METILEHLAQGADTITLRRLAPNWPTAVPPGVDMRHVRTGLIMDTETTGVEKADRVIEVALIAFTFDASTGKVLAMHGALSGLQDPGFPIPAGAMRVHGITDEDVAGKVVDWKPVAEMMAAADIIIAHNASFDRPRIHQDLVSRKGEIPEAALSSALRAVWGCSLDMLDWDCGLGKKQVSLALWHGFYYDAHRATTDCLALLKLLDVSGRLPELWQRANASSFLVRADKAPYAKKDLLKSRKYKWDMERKVWWRELPNAEAVELEKGWLTDSIYGRGKNAASVESISPASRYL